MIDWFGLLRDGELIAVMQSPISPLAPDVLDFGMGYDTGHDYQVCTVRVTLRHVRRGIGADRAWLLANGVADDPD